MGTYMNTYLYILAYKHACMRTYVIHVHPYIILIYVTYVYTYVSTYTYIHPYSYIYASTYMYAHMCIKTGIHLYAYIETYLKGPIAHWITHWHREREVLSSSPVGRTCFVGCY